MKKVYLFLFVACLLCFTSFGVFAENEEVYFVGDALEEENVDYDRKPVDGFVGDGVLNIEIPEEKGIIKVHVDAKKYRPKNFELYDLYFEISSLDGYGNYSTKLTATNDYSAELEVPYGKYIFNSAGAIGDRKGNFGLTIANGEKEFTVSEKENSVILNFIGKNIITGEENIEEIEDMNYEKKKTFFISEEYLKIIGVMMILLSVIIGFCLFFMISMKKYDNNNE